MSELPGRPAPPRSIRRRCADWVGWFGAARLALSVIAVVVVVGGGAWLLRTPPVPTEALLPMAITTVASSTPTAPAPTTLAFESAPGAEAEAAVAVVHVAGAVSDPGVHELPAGSRVIDAVESAGGATPDADLDRLNLAAPVTDGQRVFVPAVGGTVPPEPAGPIPTTTGEPAGLIDLNRATADELDALPGIGPTTAAAIVDHRDRNGPFAAVDDLEQVPGIGPAKLDVIRPLVTV